MLVGFVTKLAARDQSATEYVTSFNLPMSDLSLAMVEVVEALAVFFVPTEDTSSLVEETPDGGDAL